MKKYAYKYQRKDYEFEISEPKDCKITVYRDGNELGFVTAEDDGRFEISTDIHKTTENNLQNAIDFICFVYAQSQPLSNKDEACKQMEEFYNSNI